MCPTGRRNPRRGRYAVVLRRTATPRRPESSSVSLSDSRTSMIGSGLRRTLTAPRSPAASALSPRAAMPARTSHVSGRAAGAGTIGDSSARGTAVRVVAERFLDCCSRDVPPACWRTNGRSYSSCPEGRTPSLGSVRAGLRCGVESIDIGLEDSELAEARGAGAASLVPEDAARPNRRSSFGRALSSPFLSAVQAPDASDVEPREAAGGACGAGTGAGAGAAEGAGEGEGVEAGMGAATTGGAGTGAGAGDGAGAGAAGGGGADGGGAGTVRRGSSVSGST
jgi:hypothetical protein